MGAARIESITARRGGRADRDSFDEDALSESVANSNESGKTHQLPTRLTRDRERGYSINIKQVVLAFAVEFWIIALILVGTYLLIAENADDHVSREQVFSALLLPAALAMVELARVPLALAVRTQDTWHIKFLAAIGVLAAITVTAFSLSQIAWKTFDIRIAEATRAGDKLADTKTRKADLQIRYDKAFAEVDQKREIRNEISKRLGELEKQLTKVSSSTGQSCKHVMGPDGKPQLDGLGKPLQTCTPVAIVNQAQLNALRGQIASTKLEKEAAEAGVRQAEDDAKTIDLQVAEKELASAERDYRAAVNKSQLHSYTSMVTGKAVAEVTEAEVKNLEKFLIIIPSIAAAFASTLIAITAVRRLRPVPTEPVATLPDEAVAYLFGPLVTAIQREAKQAVEAALGSAPQTRSAANG